ncbi:hypothetical protein B0H17DRAFT_1065200 [Mycena rosella]|uniref:Secreted protein n=1 Tax=Mycena rosella TaxID=1033263 RepID=A0AAD7DHJ6_MYCRO|nr:hypothetical protein B0H17DRAFT_1065200 [Mycena rosella]
MGGMCLVLFGVVGGGTAVGICADSVHGRRRPCRGECRGVACRMRCPLESSSLFCCIAGMRRHLPRSAARCKCRRTRPFDSHHDRVWEVRTRTLL